LYTVPGNDGERDLQLEHNLSRVEHEFYQLRKNKLSKQKPLTSKDFLLLCMFTAAMFGRTKQYKENWSSQWQQVLDFGERIESEYKEASPENRKRIASALNSNHFDEEESLSLDDVRELVKNPITSTLSSIVTGIAPILFEMPSIILCIDNKERFITSDSPCVWFDPASFQAPTPRGAGGLISPTNEITLPLSPNQMIVFGKKLLPLTSYVAMHDVSMIDNLNKRTRLFSHEYFISNENKIKPTWF
jgi:hypothetical protein